MQASVGGSVKATIDRVIGTIGGAFAGGVVGYVVPHQGAFLSRCPHYSARAADPGGSTLAKLPDRTADCCDRAVDTGRTTIRTP